MSLDPLYPHQIEALKKLGNGKILGGRPGSGKSKVAATYYKEQEAPRDVYVITTAKKRDSFDWQKEFYELDIGPLSGPTPIPDDKRKSATRGNRSQKSEGTSGSSSRGSNAIPSMGGGSKDPQADAFSSSGRRNDISADLSGRTRDSANDLRGNSRSISERENFDQQNSGVVRNDGKMVQGSDVSTGLAYSSISNGEDKGEGLERFHYPWVLTVDSWNNLAKYANVAGAFFIFDEQRLVGSGDWSRKFLRIAKRNRWILLSATPGDTWMDYIPVFVANNFYKNRTEFKHEHVVYNTFTKFPKVDRYINIGRLIRQRRHILVEMPFESHTKRRIVEVPLPYDKPLMDRAIKDRWHVYEDRPLRDVGEMFSVMRKVVNSDPSRLEMVRELWKIHPKLIVFYNFNYELESLRTLANPTQTSSGVSDNRSIEEWRNGFGEKNSKSLLLPILETVRDMRADSQSLTKRSNLMELERSRSSNPIDSANGSRETTTATTQTVAEWNDNAALTGGSAVNSTASGIAEWNGHKHQPIPDTPRWIYLVQYTAGAEGWNCVETDAMVLYSLNYSWKVTEQSLGRIDRLNTPFTDLWYYQFASNSTIDNAIKRALKAKETFNEAKFARMFKT